MSGIGLTARRLVVAPTVALFAAAVILGLGGCAHSPRAELSESAVVGVWNAADDRFTTRLDLRDDGTFELTDAPELVVSYTPGTDLLSCAGEWAPNPEDFLGVPNLLLVCSESPDAGDLSGRSIPVLGRMVDSELVLFFVLGDPDSARWLDLTRVNPQPSGG